MIVLPISLAGVSAGRMTACGTASLSNISESGATRLMVTVLLASSPNTPPSSRDAAFERAGRRRLQAGVRADDAVIERAGGWAGNLEDALERGDDVLHGHFLAIGELDA